MLMVAVGRCKRAETAQPELKVLLSRTTLLRSCIRSLALAKFNGYTGMTVESKTIRCIAVSGQKKMGEAALFEAHGLAIQEFL
jgi:hypothetical protein